MKDWISIFSPLSLPHVEGESFFARYRECTCYIEEAYIVGCIRTRPCVIRFQVKSDGYYKYNDKKCVYEDRPYHTLAIVTRFERFKYRLAFPHYNCNIGKCPSRVVVK